MILLIPITIQILKEMKLLPTVFLIISGICLKTIILSQQRHISMICFFEDSLLKYDFYKNDFFHERFMNNMQQMERLFWEMDSIKNKFFMEQFPEKGKNE